MYSYHFWKMFKIIAFSNWEIKSDTWGAVYFLCIKSIFFSSISIFSLSLSLKSEIRNKKGKMVNIVHNMKKGITNLVDIVSCGSRGSKNNSFSLSFSFFFLELVLYCCMYKYKLAQYKYFTVYFSAKESDVEVPKLKVEVYIILY